MRLALIRKAGAVIGRACTHSTLATVMGPRALVIQPIDFRTLLLYYMVAIAIVTTDDRGAPKNTPWINWRFRAGACARAAVDFICRPLVYSARKRTYIRRNRNQLSVTGRYYVTAGFRIQPRTESLGSKLRYDSRCMARARARERDFLCEIILSSESVAGKEDEVSRRTWKKSRRSNRLARAPVLRKVTRLELGATLRKAFPACRWHLHRARCANYIGPGAFPFARSNIVRCNFSFSTPPAWHPWILASRRNPMKLKRHNYTRLRTAFI